MTRWFRFYDSALDDSKVQRLPAEAFRFWVNFLCLASRNNGNVSRNVSDLAFAFRMSEADVKEALAVVYEAGLIDDVGDGYEPHNWGERQYKSDTSTERVKRFRKRSETVSETPPEQNRAETEHIQSAREDILRVKADIVSAYWPDMPPDTGRIDVWMGQGYALGLIAAVVPDIVRRKKPLTLAYCDKALDDAAQKRAPPHPPDTPQGEALVFIDQDSDAWARAVAIEPKRPLQTKKGRGAYFAPDIAKQALAEFPTQARA